MNATSHFQGMTMEVLGNLVGRACLIYVDDMKVILFRFMERGLFFAARKIVLFTK